MEIGTVVTFKSHPFVELNTSIIISGEHLMLPPLMVVVEVINIIKDEYTETEGIPIAKKGNCHCKCIWFSSKINQFEEAWFYSIQLNLVENLDKETTLLKPNESIADIHKNLIGKLVAIKTLKVELGKQKSSLSKESVVDNSKNKTTISSLLSFVGPVMQVIDIKENDNKEAKFDAKNGNQKKFLSKYNVKCKWYNPSGEKFSEKILPIEALLVLPSLSQEKLILIQKYVEGVATILKINESLAKPLFISYRSGFYYLNYFDFIKNRNDEINVHDETQLDIEKKLFIKEYPDFKLITSHPGAEWKIITTIESIIDDCIVNKNYLRITYKDSSENITTRTLKNLVVETVLEGPDATTYLNAYCHLRKSKRYFKIDRIEKAQQMNLKYASMTEETV